MVLTLPLDLCFCFAFTCLVIVLTLPLDLCFCFFLTCFTERFFPLDQSIGQPVHLNISGPSNENGSSSCGSHLSSYDLVRMVLVKYSLGKKWKWRVNPMGFFSLNVTVMSFNDSNTGSSASWTMSAIISTFLKMVSQKLGIPFMSSSSSFASSSLAFSFTSSARAASSSSSLSEGHSHSSSFGS